MTTYRIEWTDSRFDDMAPGDRLEAIKTLIEHGVLDLGGDGVTGIRVYEVPAASAPAITLEPLTPIVETLMQEMMQRMQDIEDAPGETIGVILDMVPVEVSD